MRYRALSGFVEKRKSPRTEVRWPVTIMTETGAVEGEARNISVEGAFILFTHSTENLAPPNSYRLLIEPDGEQIEVVGNLVWSSLDVHLGKGFCFVGFRERDQRRLRKAIKKYAEISAKDGQLKR
jgi:PilZ domain